MLEVVQASEDMQLMRKGGSVAACWCGMGHEVVPDRETVVGCGWFVG